MLGRSMNGETIWNEAVLAHCRVVSENLPAGPEENHKNLVRIQSLDREQNPRPPEYIAAVPTPRQ